ncbi:hypothetical protein PR048_002422 [Dryococelus australis]|uniref:Uncharacterized protein n=1 Tax=Dryococelus australis TaxID=614101 RepID=A0ABQ9IK54_9NEOP|nr:hypothetical protein PR048_002422 [Dryococelus australis]
MRGRGHSLPPAQQLPPAAGPIAAPQQDPDQPPPLPLLTAVGAFPPSEPPTRSLRPAGTDSVPHRMRRVSPLLGEKRGIYKAHTGTPLNSAVTTKRKYLNWRAVFSGGGLVARPPVLHPGEPGSIPGKISFGFSYVGIVLEDDFGDPPLPSSFRRCSIHRFTAVSSQDLNIKSCPHLFTHSLHITSHWLDTHSSAIEHMLSKKDSARGRQVRFSCTWAQLHFPGVVLDLTRGSVEILHTIKDETLQQSPVAAGCFYVFAPEYPQKTPLIATCTTQGFNLVIILTMMIKLYTVLLKTTHKLDCSPPIEANRVQSPAGSLTELSQVGIVLHDASSRRAFSGIPHFPRPRIPAPLHSRLISPSSDLKTSLLRGHDGNTARRARRSDETLGVRVSVARIAPSFLDFGRAAPTNS